MTSAAQGEFRFQYSDHIADEERLDAILEKARDGFILVAMGVAPPKVNYNDDGDQANFLEQPERLRRVMVAADVEARRRFEDSLRTLQAAYGEENVWVGPVVMHDGQSENAVVPSAYGIYAKPSVEDA